MARTPKLKVFRTPIGFHDAYVAAPSQKAAMEAWGSDKDLFSRGEAEMVTDPALTAEPLAQPGIVVKRLRGTAEEQIAALPPNRPKPPASKTAAVPEDNRRPKPPRKKQPRPSRVELDTAEAAIEQLEADYAKRRKVLADREAAIEKERRMLAASHSREAETLESSRDAAAAAYDAAMRAWRG